MLCFPLTEFTTIRAASSITNVTQPESQWLDLTGFADVIAFLEVREFTLGGATTLTCAYQTAPTKDESFFQNITTAVTIANGLTVTPMLKGSVTNPLSRYIRWKLGFTGSPASAWDVVFRIWLACNAEGKLRGAIGMSPETRGRVDRPVAMPATSAIAATGAIPPTMGMSPAFAARMPRGLVPPR